MKRRCCLHVAKAVDAYGAFSIALATMHSIVAADRVAVLLLYLCLQVDHFYIQVRRETCAKGRDSCFSSWLMKPLAQ